MLYRGNDVKCKWMEETERLVTDNCSYCIIVTVVLGNKLEETLRSLRLTNS